MKPSDGRIATIDGLRGIAVLMVTFTHLYGGAMIPYTWWSGAGSLGVSLFFALSGFCLYYPIVKRRDEPVSWKRFYVRRVLRILPPYYSAIIVWSLVKPQWIGPKPAIQWLTHLTFLHPLFKDTWGGFHPPFWSIGTEEQFYWIFPLIVLCMLRWPWRTLLAAAAISIGLQFSVRDWFYSRWVPFRIVEFAVGMMAATALARGYKRFANIAWIIGAGGALLAPYLRSRIVPEEFIWWWPYILFAPCWGLIIYGVTAAPRSWQKALLSFKPLAGLGVISYSFYLYNYFVIVGPEIVAPKIRLGSPLWFVVAVATLLAVSLASYYITEKPFMALRARLHAPRKTRADATPVACAAQATTCAPASKAT